MPFPTPSPHLRTHCLALQCALHASPSSRPLVRLQANALLEQESAIKAKSVHLVRETEALSKRVIFAVALIGPLAAHTLWHSVGIEVTIADPMSFAQGMGLLTVLTILYRARHTRWRRVNPARVLYGSRSRAGVGSASGGAGAGSGASPASGRRPVSVSGAEADPRPRKATSADLASEEELEVLNQVKRALWSSPPPLLTSSEPYLDVQLIRFLREHGPHAAKLESCFRRACEWRDKNLPPIPAGDPAVDDGWLGSSEMPYGDWACKYAFIGIHCGCSRHGCPVKIERLGRYDIAGLESSLPGGKAEAVRNFHEFYIGLNEFLVRKIDLMSVAQGRLVQTYEVFDLYGLGKHMLTWTVLNFTKDILLNIATHYPSSFRKAVIINAPPFVPRAWALVSYVLPASVKAKVDAASQRAPRLPARPAAAKPIRCVAAAVLSGEDPRLQLPRDSARGSGRGGARVDRIVQRRPRPRASPALVAPRAARREWRREGGGSAQGGRRQR